MDNYDIVNAFSDDEDVPIRRQRVVRRRPNHFEIWDNKEFFQRFRLSARTIENILEELDDVLRYPTNRYIEYTACKR